MDDGVATEAGTAARPPARTGLVFFLLLIGAGLGVAVGRYVVPIGRPLSGVAPVVEAAPAAAQAPFTRVGDRIVVPATSLLRSQLVVTEIVSKSVSRTIELPAVVEADPSRTVKVMPPVAGRITDLKVQLGARVVKGEVLSVIESGDLALAFSDDEKARAAVKMTKQALDRLSGLERYSAIAIKDRESAQNDFAQAKAELERSGMRLRAIGVQGAEPSQFLSVTAPMSGSVIDMQVAPGAFVNDPTAAMMTIANLDTIWVTANVPEKDTSFVSPGQPVSVTFAAYPETMFNGKVLFVSDVLEPDTRRTKVRIAFENPNKTLKPNMFATAAFIGPARPLLVVPTSALLMTNDRTSVFVEVADWTFERRDVELASQDASTAAIKSGLQPGQRVVVKGGVRLND